MPYLAVHAGDGQGLTGRPEPGELGWAEQRDGAPRIHEGTYAAAVDSEPAVGGSLGMGGPSPWAKRFFAVHNKVLMGAGHLRQPPGLLVAGVAWMSRTGETAAGHTCFHRSRVPQLVPDHQKILPTLAGTEKKLIQQKFKAVSAYIETHIFQS
ncbi:hypothetical protein MHYP_G00056420 [Metynnis hypsauchen]